MVGRMTIFSAPMTPHKTSAGSLRGRWDKPHPADPACACTDMRGRVRGKGVRTFGAYLRAGCLATPPLWTLTPFPVRFSKFKPGRRPERR